ncbi:MAG TPA: RNA polymerase sigma-70 factor [Mucilaginibacter sp.]|nr:RNA polymerase sigma-70 factor [Mucilaginibacter sp.]
MIAAANLKTLQERIARHGDTAAYKELFLTFYNPLLRFAISFVKSREQAEEIVSDVFIHIWEKRNRLQGIGNLKVYLFISIKNTALNYISRQKNKPSFDINEATLDLESIYFDPLQLMVTGEMVARIRAAIEQLPPKCKLIFKLVKEDDLTHREVADILSLSVKTVEAQLAIALKKIGKTIQFDRNRVIHSPASSTR